MLPDYLTRNQNKQRDRVKRSQKQERSVADNLDGRPIGGSGGGREKGDVNTKQFKIECKQTEKDSISIKRSWMRKIEVEAFDVGKNPLLVFDFEKTEHSPQQRWVCIREQDFLAFQEFMESTEYNG